MAQKDAWRAYYELALGFTDTSRKKAVKIIKNVAGKGGVSADQLQELVNTAMANREAMSRMVKVEIDRALGRVGLATMDEVDDLTKKVRDLERQLADAPPAAGTTTAAASASGAPASAPKKTAAKKTVAKKTAAPGASEPAHTVTATPAASATSATSRRRGAEEDRGDCGAQEDSGQEDSGQEDGGQEDRGQEGRRHQDRRHQDCC